MTMRKWFLVAAALLTACSPAAIPAGTPMPRRPTIAPETRPSTRAPSTDDRVNPRIEDTAEYSFPQLIPFDGIPPVYDPQFASASGAPLRDDELVIGVALGDEAKAYPITVLRFREMVDDELAGIPILVTW